jgi:TonB family protein
MSGTRLISVLAAGLAILVAACWFVTGAFPLAASEVVNDAPGVTVDLGGAGVMHRTGVSYPEAARKRGVQGTVVVEVKLDANGSVRDAHVVSGPEELRSAVLESVLQWHLTKDLAWNSRQVSISFHLPNSLPVEAPAAAAGAAGGVYRVGGGRTTSQPASVRPTVKGITVSGLSDQARADLLSQLPVHEGDALSAELLQNVTRAAKAFDEHLVVVPMFAGSAEATLVIMAPADVRTDASPTSPPRIRVGSTLQNRLVFQPRAIYPPEAKKAHVEGVVKLSAIIAKDGTVQNLEVISGDPALVQAALDAVEQWIYQPTLLNGEPVEIKTQIDVSFTLSQ